MLRRRRAMTQKKIGKKEVKQALAKYGIVFGFPYGAKTGAEITCWSDHYKGNEDTQRLKAAIKADSTCLFVVSRIPSNMMSTVRLERR